ncbi:MAG: hypothetical protein JNL61_17580, partial [Rhizobiaceae bacterium]|nr:hypothetical protein [Rhizobiaceae bacterium]
SPAGPHTHVLPKLLRTGRTHSANMPVPSNLVPVAFMHPPGGLVDTACDLDRHERFQTLLRRWGNQDLHSFKQQVLDLVELGAEPASVTHEGRFQRASLRIALRQQAHCAVVMHDLRLAAGVAKWQGVYDEPGTDLSDDEAPGH